MQHQLGFLHRRPLLASRDSLWWRWCTKVMKALNNHRRLRSWRKNGLSEAHIKEIAERLMRKVPFRTRASSPTSTAVPRHDWTSDASCLNPTPTRAVRALGSSRSKRNIYLIPFIKNLTFLRRKSVPIEETVEQNTCWMGSVRRSSRS